MFDKDPESWKWLASLFTPEVKAALFTIFMAGLRILYENKEGKLLRKVLETLLCGALTYAAASGLTFFTLPPGVSICLGGMIGLMGADYVRDKAKRIFEKRIEQHDFIEPK